MYIHTARRHKSETAGSLRGWWGIKVASEQIPKTSRFSSYGRRTQRRPEVIVRRKSALKAGDLPGQ
ncbi:hypothetical protein SK128_023525, partial [Halocaridina rubra]